MDAEERDILKGIRRREIPLLLKIYPIFRHYIKDRESAKKDGGEKLEPFEGEEWQEGC